MRLWHIDLIPYLPRQQLISQWRECVCIAKNLAEKGTPNHILVNKILDYGSNDFIIYGEKIMCEMRNRNYLVSEESKAKFYAYCLQWRNRRKQDLGGKLSKYALEHIRVFYYWHNCQYLTQCFYNLQEKYDCGGMSEEEYAKLKNGYHSLIMNDNYSVVMNFSKEEFAQYLHNVQTEAVRNQRAKEVDEWMCFLGKDPKPNVRK